eukprot:gnl/Spiro4/15282_TR8203_c0_g1_i1.p1 gnl/Spiro4/15282_TR8203_c0_g1~~gnl/Spiro4/15282_TR8203_c0_g1_i1.p1  ORF type:complete len:154 (-),score=56.00 gnl/Spiro4/15282_TR8203_c0_g1_i1:317-778(-)
MERYRRKFGPGFAQMIPRMIQVGQSVGIQFSYGGLVGNTFDSHRLLSRAAKTGLDAQDRLVNELFRNYFEEEKDISDNSVLNAAAQAAGLGDMSAFLASDEEKAEVLEDLHKIPRGVNGVPHFMIHGGQATQTVGGAGEVSEFESIFRRLAAA